MAFRLSQSRPTDVAPVQGLLCLNSSEPFCLVCSSSVWDFRSLTSVTVSIAVGRHAFLELAQLGPTPCPKPFDTLPLSPNPLIGF